MTSVITGAYGFIGKHLSAYLKDRGETVIPIVSASTLPDWEFGLGNADVVYHLAGVNRPKQVQEFFDTNAGLTWKLCGMLKELHRQPKIVLASSIQAVLGNPYGISKKLAEDIVRNFARQSGSVIRIHRLRNVFGEGCRPNYNSVVATFCHNIANDLPVHVADEKREIELVYVKDVVTAMANDYLDMPSTKIPLGDLRKLIEGFCAGIAPFDCFQKQLFDTYKSYERT